MSKRCTAGRSALKRVTALDEDPFDKPVDLGDVIAAAKELRPAADVDWS